MDHYLDRDQMNNLRSFSHAQHLTLPCHNNNWAVPKTGPSHCQISGKPERITKFKIKS